MAEEFSRKALKVVVALICQTIGWNGIQSTPFEILIDLLQQYLVELGRVTHRYAELFGHTLPNLDDVGLAFREMGVNLPELEDYIKNVDAVTCGTELAKFPVARESHLNFLKPGSREVVTRPVHVHEHLPPMYPEMEEEEYVIRQSPLSIDTASNIGSTSPLASPKTNVFKRPGDPISLENPALKRARILLEEEGRPLREISSVMMTTSGFLSPAREGKLPEPRTPLQPSDSRSNSPQPSSYPMVPPEVKGEKKSKKMFIKKTLEGIKRLDKENKKKENKLKELNKLDKQSVDDSKVKKLVSMKELSKLKALKSGALKLPHSLSSAGPSTSGKTKLSHSKLSKLGLHSVKAGKHGSFMQKGSKVEKPHTTLPSGMAFKSTSSAEKLRENNNVVEGKLSTEPDKQKLNIFKKISSKAKEEKTEKVERSDAFDSSLRDSRESSPRLIIDESEVSSRQREARMAQIDDCIDAVIQRSIEIAEEEPKIVKEKKPPSVTEENSKLEVSESVVNLPGCDSDVYAFDDDLSPPGTPLTPRTPELPTPSRKVEKSGEMKEKKKKKSKKESKGKINKGTFSPKKMKPEIIELYSPERPITPEAPETRETLPTPVFPFYPHFIPTPGLIPPPLGHPLFPRYPVPLGKNLPHPAMPNLPLPPPLFMQPPVEDSPNQQQQPSENSSEPPAISILGLNTKTEKNEKTQLSSHLIKKTLEKKVKEHKKEKKDKTKKKKDRKDKGKNKEKAEKKKLKIDKKERLKEKLREKKEKKEKRKEKEREEKQETSVPKITFRLGPASPRPPTPEPQPRKIVIKPVVKKLGVDEGSDKEQPSDAPDNAPKREPSPELARISALITRPPKMKPSSKPPTPEELSPPPIAAVASPSSSPDPSTLSRPRKPPKPKPKDVVKKIGAEAEPQQEPVAYYYDNDGNKVWICPACGGQDDGSPMIGCDDCDAWYHWVCVGIQVAPDENEDWYCRVCIVKKEENVSDKKKKSRKRKVMV